MSLEINVLKPTHVSCEKNLEHCLLQFNGCKGMRPACDGNRERADLFTSSLVNRHMQVFGLWHVCNLPILFSFVLVVDMYQRVTLEDRYDLYFNRMGRVGLVDMR